MRVRKRKILVFLVASLSCTHSEKMSDLNSSYSDKHPLETLNWQYSPADITEHCKKAQDALKAEFNNILNIENPNLENSLERVDRMFTAFGNRVQPLDFYRYVMKDHPLQEAAKLCFEESERLHLSLFSNEDFYKVIKKASQKHKPKNSVQKLLLEDYMHSFMENGLELSSLKRAELLALRSELIKVQSTFSQTLNSWKVTLNFSKEELTGLPESILNDLEKSKESGKDYVLTLKYPHVYPALKYVKDESVRKSIYEAFKSRGGKENSNRLAKAIDLRTKIARLLGYKDFASYRLDMNMAHDTGTVKKFLRDLQTRLKEMTKSELANLLKLKQRELKNPDLKTINFWDLAYYENILLNEKFKVNEEEVKAYFPVKNTIAGMFKIYQTLFDVTFIEASEVPVWHPDVKTFRVIDNRTQELLGQFYMDLFPRDEKYGHAANFGLINGYEREDGFYVRPISAIVTNFTKPTKTDPGLLTHQEVDTLFHEFGHVVHHVLSRAKYGNFSGTSVKRDFVEAPSQMMENWVWEKSILKDLTSHYKTGKSMPEDLMNNLLRTRNFNQGIYYTNQIFYSSIDLAFHTVKSTKKLNVTSMYQKLLKDINLLEPLKDTRAEASFDHLMGGYEAGYYGYLWSKVYASDMFTRFEKEGLLNPKTGREYRKSILEQGGSKEPMDLITEFLKRKPNNEAFLRLISSDV